MTMLNQTALFFHFVSLLIVGGGMIALILAERRLWKELNTGPDRPGIWIDFIQSATKFILVAIALFFISGLILLYSTNWVPTTALVYRQVCVFSFVYIKRSINWWENG